MIVAVCCEDGFGVYYNILSYIKIDHNKAKRVFAIDGIELTLSGIGVMMLLEKPVIRKTIERIGCND
jgi:hypothetical protein